MAQNGRESPESDSDAGGHPVDSLIIQKARQKAAARAGYFQELLRTSREEDERTGKQVSATRTESADAPLSLPVAGAAASAAAARQQQGSSKKRVRQTTPADTQAHTESPELLPDSKFTGSKEPKAKKRRKSKSATPGGDGSPKAEPQNPSASPKTEKSSSQSPLNGKQQANGGKPACARLDAAQQAEPAATPAVDYAADAAHESAEDPTVPIGVFLVEEAEEVAANPVMQQLLRHPRYFDPDFDGSSIRCYKCGGSGHMARDCPNEERQRPCFLCGKFGHQRNECPSAMVCYRCNRPGHMARDCPSSAIQTGTPGSPGSSEPVCLRCGRHSCKLAGKPWVEGGCSQPYQDKDLAKARCMVCHKRGHLNCRPVTAAPYKPSCYNCGEGGHTADECWREQPASMRAGTRNNAAAAAIAAAASYAAAYGSRYDAQYGRSYGWEASGRPDDARFRDNGFEYNPRDRRLQQQWPTYEDHVTYREQRAHQQATHASADSGRYAGDGSGYAARVGRLAAATAGSDVQAAPYDRYDERYGGRYTERDDGQYDGRHGGRYRWQERVADHGGRKHLRWE